MDADCIFCRLATRKLPAEFLAESDHAFIIKDRAPAAAHHVLVIAKAHVADMIEAANSLPKTIALRPLDGPGHLVLEPLRGVLWLARDYVRKNLPNGSRMIMNTGEDAGQTVKHFHVHVLGGEKLKGF